MTSRLARVLLEELADDPEAREELRALLGAAESERLLKTAEAADRLGCHTKTLTDWAAAGRVRGAFLLGREWRYRASELEVLPATPRTLPPAAPGRAVRRPGPSSATESIRGTTKRAA